MLIAVPSCKNMNDFTLAEHMLLWCNTIWNQSEVLCWALNTFQHLRPEKTFNPNLHQLTSGPCSGVFTGFVLQLPLQRELQQLLIHNKQAARRPQRYTCLANVSYTQKKKKTK